VLHRELTPVLTQEQTPELTPVLTRSQSPLANPGSNPEPRVRVMVRVKVIPYIEKKLYD